MRGFPPLLFPHNSGVRGQGAPAQRLCQDAQAVERADRQRSGRHQVLLGRALVRVLLVQRGAGVPLLVKQREQHAAAGPLGQSALGGVGQGRPRPGQFGQAGSGHRLEPLPLQVQRGQAERGQLQGLRVLQQGHRVALPVAKRRQPECSLGGRQQQGNRGANRLRKHAPEIRHQAERRLDPDRQWRQNAHCGTGAGQGKDQGGPQARRSARLAVPL